MDRGSQITRQKLSGRLWAKNKGRGTIEAYTSFGKTWISYYIIKTMQLQMGIFPVVVIVPTDDLKNQWLDKLKEWEIKGTVVVINGIVLREQILNAKLIIMDEVHLMLNGELFKTIFNLARNVPYQLALTATLNPDYKRRLIAYGLPVIDTITLQEGRRNNWVAEYTQYNFGIELSEKDRQLYDKYHTNFESYFANFDYNWDTMMGCRQEEDETEDRIVIVDGIKKVETVVISQGARNYCIQNGFGIDGIADMKRNAFQAIQWNAKYKNFLYNCQAKLDITKEIINQFNVKSLSFGMSIESADKLVQMMPGSIACHSKVVGREVPKDLLYKYGMETKPGNAWKKIGKDKVNELTIKMFNAGEVKVVHSAKKLIQGSAIKEIQTIGRAIRKEEIGNKAKRAKIFKIFVRDSKDESWLEKSQKGMRNIQTIYSLNEI